MGIRVGIDLGTTFSAVARIDSETGKPVIIKNGYGGSVTPSVLCFNPDGTILYGEEAKNMQGMGDTNTASFFKRSMGKGDVSINMNGKTYTPTDLSAVLLKKLKEEAEAQTGETIDAAVITVPAYFSNLERAATMEAGKKAGLDVIAVINEPTAAAFAYGLNEKDAEQTILIYDLGGGTFDVTVAHVDKNKIQVLGSDGDPELGGKDWDDCIIRYLAQEFDKQYGEDIAGDLSMVNTLLVAAETAKKQLTARDKVKVPISYKHINGSIEITNEIFEDISDYRMTTTKDLTENLLKDLGLSWPQIDGVILVGGSTRMRMIHKYVQEMSGKPPLRGVNVDEAVALGAAIRANITLDGATLPPSKENVPNQSDQPVVTIQGAKKVVDTTAHSLGMISISKDGERFINDRIIKKHTTIPASDSQEYKYKTRSKDNELEIYVLQGEDDRPLDNTIVHKYVISKIEKTSPEESIIKVTYHYTSDNLIEVEAIQKETGKKLPVDIDTIPDDMSWTDGHPRDKPGQEGSFPDVEIMLAIDLSGSMYGEPIRKSKEAMHGFVAQMDSSFVKIGLIAFADKTECTLHPTNDYNAVRRAIDTIDKTKVGGGNRAEPFTTTLSTLRNGEMRYLVVLTDGVWSRADAAVAAAVECHKDQIDVMALGFGSANVNFLKRIASVDAFADFTSLGGLSGSFHKIAQVISENKGSLKA